MREQMRRLEDDDFDENGLLKDGHRYRVPHRMIDSKRGDARLGLHRPGPRVLTGGKAADQWMREGAQAARDEAYADYEHGITNSWQDGDNPPTGMGSHAWGSREVSDLCTIDGFPGHLKEVDGELVCVKDPSNNSDSSAPALAQNYKIEAEREHGAYVDEIQNAWRGK